ncbi:FixH family protein [Plesiomonas shigelloides]|nr:FixH family protein [Plesiomonas shigelloides]
MVSDPAPPCRGCSQFYTLKLAITHRDSLVVDDYYNKGKAINEDISRLQLAEQLHIQGDLLIVGEQARLTLKKVISPPSLLLRSISITRPCKIMISI